MLSHFLSSARAHVPYRVLDRSYCSRSRGVHVKGFMFSSRMAVMRSGTLYYRQYGTWLKQIFSRSSPSLSETHDEDSGSPESAVQVEPSEYLKQLVQSHLPHHIDNWTSAPLNHDINLKRKVLLSCEEQFNCNFADKNLGSIQTFRDVLKVISRPRRSVPTTVFPKIERTESIPANLCIQAASIQSSSKRRVRRPFQNFDSPEHEVFLNKQQKEAKKRKRRHLTAITKYYA